MGSIYVICSRQCPNGDGIYTLLYALYKYSTSITNQPTNQIRAISQEMPQPSITKVCLKINVAYLKYHSNFPGANELIIHAYIDLRTLTIENDVTNADIHTKIYQNKYIDLTFIQTRLIHMYDTKYRDLRLCIHDFLKYLLLKPYSIDFLAWRQVMLLHMPHWV